MMIIPVEMIEKVRAGSSKGDSIISAICRNKDKYPNMLLEKKNKYMGIPYKFGGDGVHGTDCGKFVCDLLSDCGYPITTRDADDIWSLFDHEDLIVEDYEAAEPGDVLFFSGTYYTGVPDEITHVGIYMPDDGMLHASSSRGVIISYDYEFYWNEYFDSVGKLNFNRV